MRETAVENHLRDVVAANGGRCIKLAPLGYVGIPDRLVILPFGKMFFVELKRPKGGVLSRKQIAWHNWLHEAGQKVYVWHNKEQINAYFED